MTQVKPIRVAVAAALSDREISSTGVYSTDSMLTNCYVETTQGKKFVVKRPGLTTAYTYNGGASTNGQGTIYYKAGLYAMGSNVLYNLTASGNGSASGSAWTASTSATWAARDRHAAVVFNGQMIVSGGENTGGLAFLNDVWASPDGVNWTQLVSAAPWSARCDHQMAVLGNTLYLMGGRGSTGNFNDVWSTTDGVNWTKVITSALWTARFGHVVVPFNQGLILMGGFDGNYKNDVWFTADGVTWSEMVQNAAWSARYYLTGLSYSNKLWVFGGITGAGIVATAYSSSDGINWTNTGSMPDNRAEMAGCVYANKMFLLGGENAATTNQTTVWSTTDGVTFTAVTSAYGGGAVSSAVLLPFRTPTSVSSLNAMTMWLLGGTVGGVFSNGIYRATLNTALASSFSPATSASTTEQWQSTTQNAGDYLILKNTKDAWVLNAGVLTKITSTNYPTSTVSGVANLDDTVYVMDINGVIYGSNLSDPFTWSALNFITADYESDTGIALRKYQNFIVAFKSTTMQFFYDAGRYPGSPLLPVPNVTARVGCVTADSIVEMDNTLVFMATSNTKGRYIAMLQGYAAVPISNPDIERILDSWLVGTCFAFPMRINGHDFYVLTLVGRAITLAYDLTEQRWHVWSTGSTYFTGCNYVTDGSFNYLQDTAVGKLYSFNPSTYTDDGSNINVTAIGDMVDGGTNTRKFCGSLTVIGDRRCNGAPNNATVYWADDDEQTWSAGVTVDLSTSRPRVNRCGSFRRRRHKITHASNNPFRVEALELEVIG